MLTKNERMSKLEAAGVKTSKYFTVDLDNGTKIHLIIDENGNPIRVDNKENDPVLNEIIADGYVRNSKLHRRFVMAKMFHMLNYVSYDGRDKGYNDCLRRMYGYDYTLKMMLEEVRVLGKLETRDRDTFEERSHFFDRETIATVLEDYITELKAYVEKLPTKNCKGVPYKKVKRTNIFVADFDKKLYAPVKSYANKIRVAKTYNDVYHILNSFMKNMVKLPHDAKKSKAWIDAYKGEGAYYTLKNLVMFHDCGIELGRGYTVVRDVAAVNYIRGLLGEYKGEYYRMFALMKKVIKDNNFDFNKRMEEIYGNK